MISFHSFCINWLFGFEVTCSFPNCHSLNCLFLTFLFFFEMHLLKLSKFKYSTRATLNVNSARVKLHKQDKTECSAKQHPTMLRRRTRTTNKKQSGIYGIVGICVPESFVFSSKDPTCCDLLQAFAHFAQQETTMLAQQCCGLLQAFARVFILN